MSPSLVEGRLQALLFHDIAPTHHAPLAQPPLNSHGRLLVIKVTRFNHSEMILNADLIEFIESTPDTVITMITGKKVLVRESADDVRSLAMDYRRSVGTAVSRPVLAHSAVSEMEG